MQYMMLKIKYLREAVILNGIPISTTNSIYGMLFDLYREAMGHVFFPFLSDSFFIFITTDNY